MSLRDREEELLIAFFLSGFANRSIAPDFREVIAVPQFVHDGDEMSTEEVQTGQVKTLSTAPPSTAPTTSTFTPLGDILIVCKGP